MTDNLLMECRNKIDACDTELVRIFEERMNASLRVAEYKDEHKLPVLDRDRELRVIARALGKLRNERYAPALHRIMEKVMEASRDLQIDILARRIAERSQAGDPIRVGYQGVNGSFSHQALESYFAGVPKVELNYNEFEDVCKAVSAGEIRYGVLPIENSSTGGITNVYDLLREYDCHIVGEKIVKVDQNLMALPGADLKGIKRVYSHPQGFEQSRDFFRQYPQMQLIPYFNTAKSAKMVSESGDLTIAAVASAQAARLYGLEILAANTNYNAANHTRFVVVGARSERNPAANKITVVVAVKHEAGSLYKTLGIFYNCGLNMVNLESRPIEGKSWEYFFHIDFVGNLDNPEVKNAIDMLSERVAYCRIMGNYVADKPKK